MPTGGDLDNLVKYALDAMNNVVYADDRQIIKVLTEKMWAEEQDSDGSTTVAIKNI